MAIMYCCHEGSPVRPEEGRPAFAWQHHNFWLQKLWSAGIRQLCSLPMERLQEPLGNAVN